MRTDLPLDPVPFEERVNSPLWECLTVAPDTTTDTHKRCAGCKKNLPLDAFHRHPNCQQGRHSRCKSCRRLPKRKVARGRDATIRSLYRRTQITKAALAGRYGVPLAEIDTILGSTRKAAA
jgi:predicted RNA-binding Zn-ribbon protein involved in translation (DUF1610 family)